MAKEYKFSEEHRRKIGEAIKGKKHYNWGKHLPPETKEKLRIASTGRKHSLEAKKKMSIASMGNKSKLGQHLSEETKKKIGNKSRGRRHSIKTKYKISEGRKGKYGLENNPNWKGGISFEPYSKEFNKQLKELIRKRDKYKCRECSIHQNNLTTKTGKSYILLIHHIDYNKLNCLPTTNLLSLCRKCHLKTNYKREYWIKHFKEMTTK